MKTKTQQTKSWARYLLMSTLVVTGVTTVAHQLQANDRALSVRKRNFQRAPNEPLIPSLKTVEVPKPKELGQYVADEKAAIQLGKALFWDTHVGSDNKIACASCHFNAGVDQRVKNTINPGTNNTANLKPSFRFDPNFTMTAVNFPFHKFAELPDQIDDTNDVLSSAGVVNTNFVGLSADNTKDECSIDPDDFFHGTTAAGKVINTRRVEPRQAPSVINAVFNFRLFWDGRANNIFNGVDPFGMRNVGAFVWKTENGKLKKVRVDLDRSHLASQAVGPVLSGFEMSCKNRLFAHVGKKLLKQKILSEQTIHSEDSVLAEFASNKPSYEDLVKKAFRKEFWSDKIMTDMVASAASMDLVGGPKLNGKLNAGFNQMEANFSLFFGLAIQMYESTLVSDNAPIDRFAEGDQNALTEQQKRGMAVFETAGKCINCHGGAELTNASFANVSSQRLERMIRGDGRIATYDNGFYNIGVRPTAEDLGVGGKDPFGRPLSETEMVKQGFTRFLADFDRISNPTREEIVRTAVMGAFKAPSLRNVELTGPYFHNGGDSTLMQVVDMYDHGGNFGNENRADLDPDITKLELTADQKKDLVAFMLSFTDERVRMKRAPFDHPSICITNGHKGNSKVVEEDLVTGAAIDEQLCLPAVGENGVPFSQRVRPFLDLSPFSP